MGCRRCSMVRLRGRPAGPRGTILDILCWKSKQKDYVVLEPLVWAVEAPDLELGLEPR